MSYFNIIKLNATPSTNDFLKEKHQKGVCQDGDLVWAKNQTSGRGQRDKMWISNPKDSLTFSVYKTYDHFPTTDNFLISMAVSLGIINALHSFNIPNLCIKWPNDIMADNKKIAGILIENIFKKKDLKYVQKKKKILDTAIAIPIFFKKSATFYKKLSIEINKTNEII